MKSIPIKNLIVPLDQYATVSEDGSMLDAIMALEEAQKAFASDRYRHRAILVIDGGGKVVGKLSQHDVLMALEPAYQKLLGDKNPGMTRFGLNGWASNTAMEEYHLWDRPLDNICQKGQSQNIRDWMYTPSEKEYIDENASMDEEIHRLITGSHHSLLVTRGDDIVGILRLTDVFDFVSNAVKSC